MLWNVQVEIPFQISFFQISPFICGYKVNVLMVDGCGLCSNGTIPTISFLNAFLIPTGPQ